MKVNFHKLFKSRRNRKIISCILIALVALGTWKFTYSKFTEKFSYHRNNFAGANSGSQIINNSGDIGVIVFEPSTADKGQQAVAINKSDKSPVARPDKSQDQSISCSFTYLQPGENFPQLDPAQCSLTSRNPVARIYNKVARQAQLQRELDGLAPTLLIQLRPTSMHLQCPSGISEENALRIIEEGLDNDLTRLEKMLADNPIDRKLAYVN
jgi:hypothetical protein